MFVKNLKQIKNFYCSIVKRIKKINKTKLKAIQGFILGFIIIVGITYLYQLGSQS